MRIPTNARTLDWIAAVGMTIAGTVAAWGGSDDSFRFEPGQAVYIRAETVTGMDDQVLEQKLHKKFLKRGVFKVTNNITKADFVFLVYSEYRVEKIRKSTSVDSKWWKTDWEESRVMMFAEGFAIPKKEYDKGLTTREDLRKAAQWQWLAGGEATAAKHERRSSELVKVFHKQSMNPPVRVRTASSSQGHFTFGPGQSVYIIAFELTGAVDIRMEGILTREFSRKRKFGVAGDLSDADLVYLVYTQYETVELTSMLKVWDPGPERKVLVFAEAFAVTPDQFEEYSADLEMLRKIAYSQQRVGSGQVGLLPSFGLPPKERHKSLVKQFHQEVAPLMAAK